MKPSSLISPVLPKILAFLAFLALATAPLPLLAAATLTQQIDPPEASVGDQVTVTFTVQNGSEATVQLPRVDGLQVAGSSNMTNITFSNGTLSSAVSQTFMLIPERPGDYTIPAFDIRTRDGEVLHARPMKLHVLAGGASPAPGNPPTPAGNGPVVMPPPVANSPGPPENNPSADLSSAGINPPLDPDGRPAKVFMVITAKTTDAYVGETIPLRIEFFIRMDSIAQQDSLPTIKGSDFLMNDLSVRPAEDALVLANEPYHRETWVTAISAPRSGDFPLEMERDTYWMKNSQSIFADPLGNFFGGRSNLAHANIASNKMVIHARPLPTEGRPADFTGAIGQFKATGKASPTTVNVGDPTYLDFTIDGEGNFGSVRCPALAPSPDWKSYAPTSQIHFAEESRTQGEKTFHQAVIPKKNGTLPLPAASFSYFDPTAKKYTTIPIDLPPITVTGTPIPVATAAPPAPEDSTITASPATTTPGFLENRLELGALHTDLTPVYRQSWFWSSQGVLLVLAFLLALGFFINSRRGRDTRRTEYALRQRSLHDLEKAMSDAAQAGNASAFFLAARRAVQLRWSAEWNVSPEAVTLAEIAARDPHLAEVLTPLFMQADEVMYSGLASGNLDLAEWDRHVREELLQPQATA